MDLLPIDLAIKEHGLAAYLRLKDKLPPSPTILQRRANPVRHNTPHLKYWRELYDSLQLPDVTTDHCDETVWEKFYHVNLDSFDGAKKHRRHSEFTAYTDGSKTDYGTGAGYVIYHKNEVNNYSSIKLNDNATVFQAEIVAIQYAADYLYASTDAKYVKILVDSQAALLALDNNRVTSKAVLKATAALEQLANKGVAVRLAWVKAHVGLEGNELADSAAKQGGMDEMGTNNKHQTFMSKAEAKSHIKERVRGLWKTQWQAQSEYRMTKQFLTQPNKQAGIRAVNLSKSSLSRLIQIVTGHNFLSYFQYKLDPTVNPLCRMCGEENETFYHLVSCCPALECRRREIFLDRPPCTDNWRPRELLDYSYEEPLNSWLTDRDYLMEQPMLELDINYSITDSDTD